MTVIASCGHELPPGEWGRDVAQMKRSRRGEGSISYGTLCAACAEQVAHEIVPSEAVEAIWLSMKDHTTADQIVTAPGALSLPERLMMAHRLADYHEDPTTSRLALRVPQLSDREIVEALAQLAPLEISSTMALSVTTAWCLARLGGRLRTITTRPDATGAICDVTVSCFWVTPQRFECWEIEDARLDRALARAVLVLETQDERFTGKPWIRP